MLGSVELTDPVSSWRTFVIDFERFSESEESELELEQGEELEREEELGGWMSNGVPVLLREGRGIGEP